MTTGTPQRPGGERRQRWLIVADSLALPRPGVDYDHTWPKLLADATPHIDWISRGLRAATTQRLGSDGEGGGDCLEFYAPHGVVLQLGICDCAPRLLRRNSLAALVLQRLPAGLGARLSGWLERRRGRRADRAWVTAAQYERNLEQYLRRAQALGTRVLALHILPVGARVQERNPLIGRQIDAYNAVLDRLAGRHPHLRCVRVFGAHEPVDGFYVDGYHLNEAGARRVAQALLPALASPQPGQAHAPEALPHCG